MSCGNSAPTVEEQEEDKEAKKQMQGTWESEIEGNVVFSVKGDTIYYNDSLSTPVAFKVLGDSIYLYGHNTVRYHLISVNSTSLRFQNVEGDDIELVRSTASLSHGEYKGAIKLNQGCKVKSDTVFTSGEKRYHAYMQVNPTTYKVYHQTTNSDGLSVENIYYDNIVYIALYDGQHKVFGQNVEKKEFAILVPEAYLSQAVLSEIVLDGVKNNAVRFVAVLSIPDTYTNYRVNIDISPDGKKTLSL